MKIFTLFCLLSLMILGSAGPAALAQTYSPSYNCAVVTDSVEVFVCHDPELAALDRDMSTAYRSYIRTLPSSEAEALKKGQIAWIQDRNTRCKVDYQRVDRDCIESAYRGRKTALEALAGLSIPPGTWERQGMLWVQLASRASADEAILIAKSLKQKAPQYQPYLVLMAFNGWYAVASGPYPGFEAKATLGAIVAAAPAITAEEPYVTKGYRYSLRLYHSQDELPRSTERPASIPRQASTYNAPSTTSHCSSDEITKRQAVCYIAFAGETACQSLLEKQSRADVVLTGMTTSAVCSAMSSGLQNGSIDPEAMLGSAVRGALSGIGSRMLHEDNDIMTRAVGFFLKAGVAGYEFAQAVDCAREVERQCWR